MQSFLARRGACAALTVSAWLALGRGFVALLALFCLTNSSAAEPAKVGPEFLVNTYTKGRQTGPAVAVLSTGGFVAVWMSWSQVTVADIYAQRYDAAGQRLGGEFRVNTKRGAQIYPEVAGLEGGGFVVVWTTETNLGLQGDAFGQCFAATGRPIGSEFRINTTTLGRQSLPRVAALKGGGFVIVWSSVGDNGRYGTAWWNKGVYGQRFAGCGRPAGNEFLVNTTIEGGQSSASVAVLEDGSFVVAWTSTALNYASQIRGQRYAANGQRIGTEFQITADDDPDDIYLRDGARVAALKTGGFVVTWAGVIEPRVRGEVYARRYLPSGRAAGPEFVVNGKNHKRADQDVTSIAALKDGGFVITWNGSEPIPGMTNGAVYAQHYNARGVAIGTEFRVNSTMLEWQGAASAVGLENGRFVVIFESAPGEPDQTIYGYGILGQIFDP